MRGGEAPPRGDFLGRFEHMQMENEISPERRMANERPQGRRPIVRAPELEPTIRPFDIDVETGSLVVGPQAFIEIIADHDDGDGAGAVFLRRISGPDQVLAQGSSGGAEAVD